MKKHLVLALLCAAAPAQVAVEGIANRFTAGLSLVSTQGDYRSFTNQPMGFGAEATFDITRSAEVINVRAMLGVVRVNGKDREDIGTKLNLNGIRAGLDFTFQTPSPKLTPYAGIILTKWSGHADSQGSLSEAQATFKDNEPKFGFRVGLEYAFTNHLVLAADYNHSEWRHSKDITTTVVKGINPVNPSWMSMTLRYRF